MTEAELLAFVTAECGRLGLGWHHCGDSRRCQGQPGFPDLVIAGPGGVVIAELKAAGGVLAPDQRWWAQVLQQLVDPFLVHVVWRPADWESGLIQLELAALRFVG